MEKQQQQIQAQSSPIPQPVKAVQKQIENVAPYADKILGYQYLGLMNPPDSKSFAGHNDSTILYEDYKNYIEK